MSDLNTIFGTGLNIIYMVGSIIISFLMVGGVMWILFYIRKYSQYKCIVFEKDGFGQLSQNEDTAGIFVDRKTKNKRLFLRKGKVGLDPDKIPFMSIKGGIFSPKRLIYLLKTGINNYHYIKINIDDPSITLSVTEEDINWGVDSYERVKKQFQHSLLMQLMPYIAIAFVSLVILIIFIYFFKEFGTLREMAIAMKEAALAMRDASSGTTVIR